MKPSPFEYHAPRSVAEALAVLAEVGHTGKILAGGQSLIPVLNMRLAAPAHLIDINRIDGLDRITVDEDAVRIGALVRHAELERDDAAHHALPLLRQALEFVAHPAIRNRGTTVGSLAHADPAGEMPAILALTDGSVTAASTRGEREIAAADLFLGPMESALAEDELVTGATFRRFAPGTTTWYDELARRSGDYALVGVAVAVTVTDGRVSAARAGFVSAHPVPVSLDLTEALAGIPAGAGGPAAAERIAAAAAIARDFVEPDDDIHASADYRRHLTGVITGRVLARALAAHEQNRDAGGAREGATR